MTSKQAQLEADLREWLEKINKSLADQNKPYWVTTITATYVTDTPGGGSVFVRAKPNEQPKDDA